MASKKDVIKLTEKDFKEKKFKAAPPNKYFIKLDKSKTKIKPGKESNCLNLFWKISRGDHKGKYTFDNISAHVGWKIAQVLKALKTKKRPKTLQELLKLLLTVKELRALTKVDPYGGRSTSKVVQYLPLTSSDDEDIDEDEDGDKEDDDNEDNEEDDQDDDDSEDDDDDDSDDEDDEDDDEDDTDDDDEDDDDAGDDDEDNEEDDEDEDDEDEDDEDNDEDDDDDDEDDEDDDKPVKRGKAAKKTTKKKPAAKKATKKRR